jgi:peptidoglycan/LPS O-acetylase OafA/YrhL
VGFGVSSNAQRTLGLDIPRAVAISLVVLSHVAGIRLRKLGFFGVELFFALSGFLIGGILYRELSAVPRWSMSDIRIFWARRWWRTLPNYYLFLLVSIGFHYAFGGLPTIAQFLRYLVFAQNLMNGENPFYGVSWSLAIEEWFYLLFPLALLFFTLCGATKRLSFLLSTAVFVLLPIVVRELLFTDTAPTAVRLMTIPRLDAVFYGVAVSFWVSRYHLSRVVRLTAFAVGLAIVAPLWALLTFHDEGTQIYRLSFVAVPLGFALTMPLMKTVRQLPRAGASLQLGIRNISVWSYSVYLMHVPLLVTIYAIFGDSRRNPLVNTLSKVLAVALCVLLSKLVYEQFEVRLTRRRPGDEKAEPDRQRADVVLSNP